MSHNEKSFWLWTSSKIYSLFHVSEGHKEKMRKERKYKQVISSVLLLHFFVWCRLDFWE